MRFGVIVFPGSLCDMDCYHVLDSVYRQEVRYIWHKDTDLSSLDCIILPGGFSYGDYLRAGAIARFSPIMDSVAHFAADGGLVLGICNGFQILCEAGLLPGALIRNDHLQFRCDWVHLRVENNSAPFTSRCQKGQVLRIPIAHGEGSYYVDPVTLAELEVKGQILLRYCDAFGTVSAAANPNGSAGNIAAVSNETGNVMGMMPHPERCAEALLGGTDGRFIFDSILAQSLVS